MISTKKVNRSLNTFEISLMKYMNQFYEDSRHGTFLSNALIHVNPEESYRMSIQQNDLERIKILYKDDIEKLEIFLTECEKPLNILESLVILSEEKTLTLTAFEKSVLSILAEMTKVIKK